MNLKQASDIVKIVHDSGNFEQSYDLVDFFVDKFELITEKEIEEFCIMCGFMTLLVEEKL